MSHNNYPVSNSGMFNKFFEQDQGSELVKQLRNAVEKVQELEKKTRDERRQIGEIEATLHVNCEREILPKDILEGKTTIAKVIKLATYGYEAAKERDKYREKLQLARDVLAWIGTYAHIHSPETVESEALKAIKAIFEE